MPYNKSDKRRSNTSKNYNQSDRSGVKERLTKRTKEVKRMLPNSLPKVDVPVKKVCF